MKLLFNSKAMGKLCHTAGHWRNYQQDSWKQFFVQVSISWDYLSIEGQFAVLSRCLCGWIKSFGQMTLKAFKKFWQSFREVLKKLLKKVKKAFGKLWNIQLTSSKSSLSPNCAWWKPFSIIALRHFLFRCCCLCNWASQCRLISDIIRSWKNTLDGCVTTTRLS